MHNNCCDIIQNYVIHLFTALTTINRHHKRCSPLTLCPPPPPKNFSPHACNSGATLLCVLHSVSKKFDLGKDLAVLKYKVGVIFIIFREFNIMLKIVDS